MPALPIRKLERHLRWVILSTSICLVTWLVLANGGSWRDRFNEIQKAQQRDDGQELKPQPTVINPAKITQLNYTYMYAMKWKPAKIKNLTHPFTTEMSCFGYLRVIPTTYKKQLTDDERAAEGNIYMPGRDVIVANSDKTMHRLPKARYKLKNTLTGKEMAAIKKTIRGRLDEHTRRLTNTPLTFDRNRLPPALLYLDPNIFKIFPQRFLDDYKSPCWWDQHNKLQCLPYFYIGGAPKCATTDMWNRLSGHGDIVRSFGKESHWWSRGNHSERDVYSFLGRNKRIYKGSKTKAESSQSTQKTRVAMDASACTFWHNFRAARILGNPPEGPPFLLSDVMRAAQPDAKLIFILRNPTDRQYSEYLDIDDLWRGKIKSPVDFHTRLENSIRLYDLCLRDNTFRHCVAVNYAPRLQIGMYSIHLREWFQRFPLEQIYILRTDEWKQNITREIEKLLKFLDLPPMSGVRMNLMLDPANAGVRSSRDQSIGPMLPETKALLDDYFSIFNEDLAKLLNDEKYLWKKSP